MLNVPEWLKILVEIKNGKSNIKRFKSYYSKELLFELQEQKFIKIEEDKIILLEKSFKLVEGIVYGFLERL